MFYRSKCIALNVIPSEWYDAKCDTVLSVCGVKCIRREVVFLKKWREFLEGGNDIWVFPQKGKHPPHRAEQEERKKQKAKSRKQKAESR